MENYFPILMFVLVGIAVGVLPVAMGFILAPSRPDPEKLSPYECGFEAFEDARMKFDVRYYLIAILFILFDLEKTRHWRKVRTAQSSAGANGCPPRGEDQSNRDESRRGPK
jgi:hypothetical protein